MENKLYVITVETGSYDDFNVKVESVTDNLAAGSTYVDKMNACAQSLVKKISLGHKAASLWAKNNSLPINKEILPNPPRTFRADEIITDAMIQALKEVKEQNQIIINENKEQHRIWQETYSQYQEQWVKDNLTSEELEMNKYHNDNYWSIDEVKWFKV